MLGKGVGSLALKLFCEQFQTQFAHFFVDPDRRNTAAIRVYEKAGFKKVSVQASVGEVWMIKEL